MSTPTGLPAASPPPADPHVTGGPAAACTHVQCPLRQAGQRPSANPPPIEGCSSHADPYATGLPAVSTDGLATGPFAAAGPTGSSSPPRLFGNDYELLGSLGQGGMGIIYKARQIRANRLVALKMIQSSHLATVDQVERFRREAQAAADLKHPHIVIIHDVGEVGGQHYFSMEWLEGGSLKELLADGPLPPRLAAEVMRQAAEACEHAHQRGIIHRDLKPHNILLERRLRPGEAATLPTGAPPVAPRPATASATERWW